MQALYDNDADLSLIQERKTLIIGYGSQGRAHALNLRDSGVRDVRVGLRPGSASAKQAQADGFEVVENAEGGAWADVVMLVAPDETHADIYDAGLADTLRKGALLLFAHGFSVHFAQVKPRADLDVAMVAPKAPGHTVRAQYEGGAGTPCLLAVHADISGKAREIALAYAVGLGGGRAGILETSFREECETDLFGEQAVLCGGLAELVRHAYETLVEAGYAPEMAYFECLHELKLIVDLMYQGGVGDMFHSISNTAEYGAYVSGPRIIDASVRERMRETLRDIQEGRFAREWTLENKARKASFLAMRGRWADHPIEEVGAKLRGMMPWLAKERLVKRGE